VKRPVLQQLLLLLLQLLFLLLLLSKGELLSLVRRGGESVPEEGDAGAQDEE
jgi:hypothetical protein